MSGPAITGEGVRLLLSGLAPRLVLMTLAAQNKWRLGPRLLEGDGSAVPRLQRTIKIEWLLIAVVLAATAVITSLYAPEHLYAAFSPEHEYAPVH